MADEPENLVLAQLREIRRENGEFRQHLTSEIDELKERLETIDTRVAGMDQKLDRVVADIREIRKRMTNVEEGLVMITRRIDRIEQVPG